MEGASECRLIGEACFLRNVGQRLARANQEILRTFDPALHEPSVRGDTESGSYTWAIPPSTNSSMPVMKELSLEARNTTALATSSGVPNRPMGT